MRPLQANSTDHRFREGTQFDDVLQLYVFDRSLRLLVMDALERVEVTVRAAISNTMSLSAPGGAFWYLDAQNFTSMKQFNNNLAVIKQETRQQQQRSRKKTPEHTDALHFPDALTHYVSSYSTPETPPSWLSIELLTLGNLLHLYSALPNKKKKTYRKQIAQQLGLHDPVLGSWLASYVRVRNICAHHGRLWNRFLGVYPVIPTSKQIRWLEDRSVLSPSAPNAIERKRLYPVLVSFQTVLCTISPHSTWASRLRDLLRQSPFVPLTALGMTEGWDTDPFWTEAFVDTQP